MSEFITRFTGKLIEAGDLDHGRGIVLEVDGQDVSFLGLTMAETKGAARLLGERLTVEIHHANTSNSCASEKT